MNTKLRISMMNNNCKLKDKFYSGESNIREEELLRKRILNKDDDSNPAEKTYFEFTKNCQIDVPDDIESIARLKLKRVQKRNQIKIWTANISIAASLILVFLLIVPKYGNNKLFSDNLSADEKRAHFEEAIKIVNESIDTKKPAPEILYNDDKFKIVIE